MLVLKLIYTLETLDETPTKIPVREFERCPCIKQKPDLIKASKRGLQCDYVRIGKYYTEVNVQGRMCGAKQTHELSFSRKARQSFPYFPNLLLMFFIDRFRQRPISRANGSKCLIRTYCRTYVANNSNSSVLRKNWRPCGDSKNHASCA